MSPKTFQLRKLEHAEAHSERLDRIESKLDRLIGALLEPPDPAPAAAATSPAATPGSAAQP